MTRQNSNHWQGSLWKSVQKRFPRGGLCDERPGNCSWPKQTWSKEWWHAQIQQWGPEQERHSDPALEAEAEWQCRICCTSVFLCCHQGKNTPTTVQDHHSVWQLPCICKTGCNFTDLSTLISVLSSGLLSREQNPKKLLWTIKVSNLVFYTLSQPVWFIRAWSSLCVNPCIISYSKPDGLIHVEYSHSNTKKEPPTTNFQNKKQIKEHPKNQTMAKKNQIPFGIFFKVKSSFQTARQGNYTPLYSWKMMSPGCQWPLAGNQMTYLLLAWLFLLLAGTVRWSIQHREPLSGRG